MTKIEIRDEEMPEIVGQICGYKLCGSVVPFAGKKAKLISAIMLLDCDYLEHQDNDTIGIFGHYVMPQAVAGGLAEYIKSGTINVSTGDGKSNYCYTFCNGSCRKESCA